MEITHMTQEELDAINILTESGEDFGEATATPSVESRLQLIDTQCAQLFSENKMFTPMYPWVFVLVCTKAQQVGSIILPEKQNKTIHEGIVLATWKDKLVERGTISKDGIRLTRCEVLKSEMHLGDHVVFPHFAGQPIPGYDVDRFRVVKECAWKEEGGIFGKIDYAGEHTKPTVELMQMLSAWISDGATEEELVLLQAKIDDRFMVVDRETASITLSGR
jgi:co-chaperonin GroES (HSP10)